MTPDPELTDLVRRLRDRDPAAVAELVRRYEPDIRRIARVRLARYGLRHLVDSVDVAQSVFGRLVARLQTGELEFESADKLLRLLTVIAANR
jgi:DNA-directed RNA polymerase specialized sigma24 family protein